MSAFCFFPSLGRLFGQRPLPEPATTGAEQFPPACREVLQAVRRAVPVLPAEDAQHLLPAEAAERAV